MLIKGTITKQVKENIHFMSDLVALNLAHMVLWIWPINGVSAEGSIFQIVFISNILWATVYFLIHHKHLNRSWGYGRHLAELSQFVGIQFIVLYLLDRAIYEGSFANYIPMYSIILLLLASVCRFGLTWFLRTIRAMGYNYKRVIVVGNESLINSFTNQVAQNPHYGYRLLGTFTEDFQCSGFVNSQSSEIDIYELLINSQIDEVFVSMHIQPEKVQSLLTFCQLNGIVINITHDFLHGLKLEPMNMSIHTDGISPTLTIREDLFSSVMRTNIKRLFDVFGSMVFLVFFGSWLFPIIALLIKLDSPGPVFFVQKRTGLNNTTFLCHKFRTMKVNNESDSKQATANDSRITPIGKFLRMTNLDELPQFYDVLLGYMSIVGPRPHMVKHTEEYSLLVDAYNERLWIKPGITGLAQSKGFRGEINELDQLHGRISHDRDYVRNWTLLLDIKIIFSTAWNMLSFQKTGA